MNILIAPNSMKGSLSSIRFADLIGQAFTDADPSFFRVRKVPVADGGDDTATVLMRALGMRSLGTVVADPLGRPVRASFGYAGDTAVIEMANASGMKLLSGEELNPLKTSSYGTGQLILEAIRRGASKIYIGVGGSATADGGSGMLEALGVRFYDSEGMLLTANGGNLRLISKIDCKGLLLPVNMEVKVICDVENPLLGNFGAARTFGPQKGATPEMVEMLEQGLANFAQIAQTVTGKEIASLKSSGAAGGISAGLAAFLHAEIVPGADFVLDTISFDQEVQWADLVITGEGKIDNQTCWNKAPYAVAKRAVKGRKPVIALAGSVESLDQRIFDAAFSVVNRPCTLEEAISNADKLVYDTARELASWLLREPGSPENTK